MNSTLESVVPLAMFVHLYICTCFSRTKDSISYKKCTWYDCDHEETTEKECSTPIRGYLVVSEIGPDNKQL